MRWIIADETKEQYLTGQQLKIGHYYVPVASGKTHTDVVYQLIQIDGHRYLISCDGQSVWGRSQNLLHSQHYQYREMVCPDIQFRFKEASDV